MNSLARCLASLGLLLAVSTLGCESPYHSDQGALFGGLFGAGVGAIAGHAMGNTAAGAVIGAAAGTVTGAAVGQAQDEAEARNRAMIEARLGRQIAAGAVTVQDVVAMTHANIDQEVIVNHIHGHGAVPLQTNDILYLQQQGVSPRVIETMQATPVQVPDAGAPPSTVIVEERPYYYYRPYHHGYYYGW